jgi:sugar transferase (PEP-CTERM/EpsH1 system associated)
VRILFVLPYLPSPIRIRPYQFIRELSRRHTVSVLASAHSVEPGELEDLSTYCKTVDVVHLTLGSSMRSCVRGTLRGEPLQAMVCQSTSLDRRLGQLLLERTFDVVHIEHLRAARLGWLIPRRTPTLFDAVDSISLLLARTLRSSHSLRQRLIAAVELRRTRAYEARLLRLFDRIVVTAPDDARALTSLAPEANVSVVRSGVDLGDFRPWDGPRDPATVVFWGKMSYHANVTAALQFAERVWPLVRRERPDARFMIVGSRPAASIRRLASDPGITVTGYVPDLRDVVARASVAVCPVTVKVGIQNKILEAMAMALPVVSTGQGLAGLDVSIDRDILVADDPSEFSRQICQLLADPARAGQLGRAGRSYVEQHHRWDRAVLRLETLYTEAIDLQHSVVG